MKRILRIVDFLSGEWMLRGQSNSGAIIFLRSVLVSVLIFSTALGLKCWLDPSTSSDFSLYQLRYELADHISWLGAIFAAIYVGFYARYSSQWSYLAGLYNQIMATAVGLPEADKENKTLLDWQAGFIEDCYFLHLDRKEIFTIVIKQMLDKPALLMCFIESVPANVADAVLSRNNITRPTR